jgi:hypothetical protein
MNDQNIKKPTDHLPPADEREPDDERTTAGEPYPGTGSTEDEGGVSPETAAEPERPLRHGVEGLSPNAG